MDKSRLCFGRFEGVSGWKNEKKCFFLQWVNALVSFNNLLQVINSAVNYVIYFCHCYKTNGKQLPWLNDLFTYIKCEFA
jgi:hypothetical protein